MSMYIRGCEGSQRRASERSKGQKRASTRKGSTTRRGMGAPAQAQPPQHTSTETRRDETRRWDARRSHLWWLDHLPLSLFVCASVVCCCLLLCAVSVSVSVCWSVHMKSSSYCAAFIEMSRLDVMFSYTHTRAWNGMACMSWNGMADMARLKHDSTETTQHCSGSSTETSHDVP